MIIDTQALDLTATEAKTEVTYVFVEDADLLHVGGGNMVANY